MKHCYTRSSSCDSGSSVSISILYNDWRQNLDQMDGNGEVECFCHATDTELIVYNFTVPLAQDEFLASL